jgi:hypothetical protein
MALALVACALSPGKAHMRLTHRRMSAEEVAQMHVRQAQARPMVGPRALLDALYILRLGMARLVCNEIHRDREVRDSKAQW